MLFTAENAQGFSQSDLYVSDPDGRNARDLSARLDRNVEFGLFARGAVVVGANDATHRRLFALAADGTPRALPLGAVELGGGASAARDGTLAFNGVTPAHPAEVYVLRPGAGPPRRLTGFNDAAVAGRLLGSHAHHHLAQRRWLPRRRRAHRARRRRAAAGSTRWWC